MQEFLDMGGYGSYVWSSYGITAVVMLVVLVQSIRSLSATQATQKRLQTELGIDKEQEEKEAES